MSTSTLAEVLDLPFALVTVFMAVLRALVTAPFRHRGTRRSPRSLYLYLVYSALRCLVIRISPKQCQMVMPSSHFTHQFVGMLAGQRRLAKAAAQGGSVKAEADTAVVLPHNATGHWVGAPEAEVVVMWFHGMFSLAFVPVPDPLVAIDEVEHETRNLKKTISPHTHYILTRPRWRLRPPFYSRPRSFLPSTALLPRTGPPQSGRPLARPLRPSLQPGAGGAVPDAAAPGHRRTRLSTRRRRQAVGQASPAILHHPRRRFRRCQPRLWAALPPRPPASGPQPLPTRAAPANQPWPYVPRPCAHLALVRGEPVHKS